MTAILEHYQTYVPSVTCEKHIPEMGKTEDKRFLTTLVGGDYLSVARARGAQLIRSTSELVKHTLGGILPVAEDWHAKVCFMEVRLLYNCCDSFHFNKLLSLVVEYGLLIISSP